MNPVSPLELSATGQDVANLQDALFALIERGLVDEQLERHGREKVLHALHSERAEQNYGRGTRIVVAAYQEARGLESSGAVDEATAEALNADLREHGLLDEEPAFGRDRSLVVSGRLTDSTGAPMAGLIVRAFHVSKEASMRLGTDVSDREGLYTISVSLPGIPRLALLVDASGESGEPLASSGVLQGAGPIATVDLVVPHRPQVVTRRLQGAVVDQNGAALADVTLRLYRRGFGGEETLLAESSTAERGRYALEYEGARTNAGLEVRAVGADGEERAVSKVMHDLGARERATVNLVAPHEVRPCAPEFDRLAGDLAETLGDFSAIAGARETVEQQDLTYLNRVTGWDARLLALAGKAARLAGEDETGLPPPVVYSLLRVGLPSEKTQLAQVGPDSVQRALETARDAGIVSMDEGAIREAAELFERFASTVRLSTSVPGSASTYGEFIAASGVSAESQQTFAHVLLSGQRNGEGLWAAATEAGIPDDEVHRLRLQGKIAFLTGHSGSMTAGVQKALKIDAPADLVSNGMYSADRWKDLAHEVAGGDEQTLDGIIPEAYRGDGVEERLNAYAEDMARKVRRSYNTEVIAHVIANDSEDRFGLGENRKGVATVLTRAAAQGFRFGKTSFDTFVASKPQVFDGITEDRAEPLRQEMRMLQRVYQLTPNDEAMEVLKSIGLTSAYDIVAVPYEAFVAQYGHLFKFPKEVELVYRKAQQVSSVTFNLFTVAKKLDAEVPVYGVSAPVEVRETVKSELIRQFPTMETLFGSMDFCECEHCHSVLSPAAYLVDLLQFLDPEEQVWDNFLAHWSERHGGQSYEAKYKKPYEALIARRPDIVHIPLTCENTHTLIPYIDVVNECLEYYAANGRLTEDAAYDTGDAESADLLAEPANVIRAAYDIVREARYPLALPFDLWLETVRAFCDHFEVPLAELLEVFRPGDELFVAAQSHDRFAVFMESLRLVPAQVALFTDPDPLGDERWRELYGYARMPVSAPTNSGDATVSVPDAAAPGLDVDEPYTHLNVSTGAVVAESLPVKVVGAAGSGGGGSTLVTFDGAWTTPPAAGDLLVADVPGILKSAKALSRRLGVTYKELIAIVQTWFVNPVLNDLTILYKLGLTMTDVLTYVRDRALTGADPATMTVEEKKRLEDVRAFEASLTAASAEYAELGFDAAAWLETVLTDGSFGRILVLNDLDAGCDFDATILQYADGSAADAVVFLRLNLFVRLWRHLGWTIDETDRCLQTFVPASAPFEAAHLSQAPLATALVYLAHARSLDSRVKLGKDSRQKLLTLWSDIPTTGKNPLYTQLFLRRSLLRQDDVFDDPMGVYLSATGLAARAKARTHRAELAGVAPADAIDPAPFASHTRVTIEYDTLREVQMLSYLGVLADADKATLAALSASPHLAPLLDAVQAKGREFSLVKGHLTALQGALGLTADDAGRILGDAGMTLDSAELTLANVSLLYRYTVLAKAAGLPVRDLVALRDMSEMDPLKALHPDPLTALTQDYPFTQTIAFLDLVDRVRRSGIPVAELEYLLRHRYDESGPHKPDTPATLALLRTIGEGVRAIRTAHAVPADPAEMTEETLRQELGLALPAEVVDRFVGMMNGTVELTVTKDSVAPADKLDPARFQGEPSIVEVAYDDGSQQQKLTFRGVLFDDLKTALEGRLPRPVGNQPHVPSPLFAALLTEVQAQAAAFFETHLKLQPPGTSPAGGFLADADFDHLFRPPAPNATLVQLQDRLREQKTLLSHAFLPYLQQRLIRQLVLATMTAETAAEPSLVETLVTDPAVLVHPASTAEPLVEAFAGCGERGVSAEFFPSSDLTGAGSSATLPDADFYDTEHKVALQPAGTNSARLETYLEVPASGAYRLFVFLEKAGATAQLAFAGAASPLPMITATTDAFMSGGGAADFVELEAGVPHRLTVTLRQLGGGRARVMIQGETLGRDRLAAVPITPAAAVDAGERAVVLLEKVLRLVDALTLSRRELEYVSAHAAAFGNLALSKLPTRPADDTAQTARDRFWEFTRLASYAGLKAEMGVESDELIAVFEAPTPAAAYPILATITRRPEETVKSAAKAVLGAPAFTDERPLRRAWEALRVVERFGVGVPAIVSWRKIVDPDAGTARRFEIARDVKHTLKARFAPETWNRVAQPIHDKLRARQRDALVAYVMHTRGFTAREQLYEYFLIDPGMEPVVQTSRIRLAIGAVQLFIQRILLNLEPTVHPAVVNAKHWEWMKRYRVWEANRKIFLFPENWLEPEFRDDKTHLYSELEGALLQGDVSNDLVEDAFLNYLRKLDELARLDVRAMHLEHKADPAQNTLHVIARTYTEPHKYFYRRYAHRVWTPWEPVGAEITGDHLAPVVWRERLYLFWVSFMQRAEENGQVGTTTANTTLAGAKLTDIAADVRAAGGHKWLEPNLNWSEFVNGEWSTRESGGVGATAPILAPVKVPSAFDVNSVFVHVVKRFDDGGNELGVEVHLGNPVTQAFYLPGRNSLPEPVPYRNPPRNPYTATTARATRYHAPRSALGVSYTERSTTVNGVPGPATPKVPQMILREGESAFNILPCDNDVAGDPEVTSLIKPIFYQDRLNTLFVEPTLEERRIEEWEDYLVVTEPPDLGLDLDWWDDLHIMPEIPHLGPPEWFDPLDPIWDPPFDESILGGGPHTDWLINYGTGVLFDGEVIGARGRLDAEVVQGAESFHAPTAGGPELAGQVIRVETGGALAADVSLVVNAEDAMDKAGLRQGASALNIIGGDGFNASLASNLAALEKSAFGDGPPAAGQWQ